jgi:hypothetical protein
MDWLYRLMGERLLFLTHTAVSFKKGDIHDDNYRITRIISVSPTSLYLGGAVECSEVWGKHIVKTKHDGQ